MEMLDGDRFHKKDHERCDIPGKVLLDEFFLQRNMDATVWYDEHYSEGDAVVRWLKNGVQKSATVDVELRQRHPWTADARGLPNHPTRFMYNDGPSVPGRKLSHPTLVQLSMSPDGNNLTCCFTCDAREIGCHEKDTSRGPGVFVHMPFGLCIIMHRDPITRLFSPCLGLCQRWFLPEDEELPPFGHHQHKLLSFFKFNGY